MRARKRVGRRYRTGRNQQINIKATPEVIERLYKLADQRRVPLGALLEQAVEELEKTTTCEPVPLTQRRTIKTRYRYIGRLPAGEFSTDD